MHDIILEHCDSTNIANVCFFNLLTLLLYVTPMLRESFGMSFSSDEDSEASLERGVLPRVGSS